MGHGKELRVKMGGGHGERVPRGREGGQTLQQLKRRGVVNSKKNIITDDSNRKSPLFMDANFEGRKASTVVTQRGGGESIGGSC